ncbi:Lsr2-like briding protein [Streptomyces phage Izzy]|uniref:Lsr2-like briding protein n=8 Tax=Likavirus TaxID=1982880 RepID=A0A0K1Y990_9CAUD|nr:Lsr2-like DNA bridging protein [Streptomyces phage Caliburn]YP_009215427.1 Lsr2-like DNA bridging protein [Streptomyces phage Izzy]YP_009616473.1 Lsr2-like DNA bridging protein [Streptomyces phage Aaronocolus]ATE84926.1 Lsr2-like briding protein [Streptomyces phage BeardedLady]ATE85228.1 Lsr2-like briding protein [Streptomyces phage Esperer]ATE85303.1 Lsr2-like briding protein [Streptomyces phage Jash]ATE85379.1 Lsr2-like briding protein [Streptomyces phage Oliynyk]QGJ91565.1 Lsr2-like DN
MRCRLPAMKKTVIELVDDLDGKGTARTVTFALDGHTYEIELNERNEARLHKALAPFVKAGRKAKPTRRRRAK